MNHREICDCRDGKCRDYKLETWPDAEDTALLAEWIATEQVWRLAVFADCGQPDGPVSAGGRFLREVAVSALDVILDPNRGSLYEHLDDRIHEVADGCIPWHTNMVWDMFMDLDAYTVDLSDYGGDLSDLTRSIGATSLYVIAETLARCLLSGDAYHSSRLHDDFVGI